jgi:glycosyltransferase involved in cell wall biosynthesis
MKTIVFDARFYGTQVKGLGRYTQELLRHLAQLDHDFRFRVLLNTQGREEFDVKDNRFTPVAFDVPWYGLTEQWALLKVLKAEKADLAHFPHFNAPYFCKTPYVVTIHDTILFDHPSRRASTLSWPLYQAKYWAFKHHFSRVARKASGILTVSDYSRSRISRYVPEAKEKIIVTRIAPSSQLSIPAATTKAQSTQSPYLLYVGNAYPHKNLEFLIRGFHKLWLQRNDLSLVLVGKLDYFYERLKELSHQLDWKGKSCPVRFFGYATEKQLSDLYTNSTLYVFPSLDEGFGIPPLEAMQMGVPVLSSFAASMPEVLGDAAMYFDPTNESDFCTKVADLLQNEAKRAELVQKGRAQVGMYSWSLCAQQTTAVYQRILRKPL